MLRLVVLLVALSVLIAGCGGAPDASPAAATPDAVALRTAAQPAQACMDALATGRLVPITIGGLGLLAADGTIIAVEWPFGYSAVRADGRIVLLDDRGQAVASEGDVVQMGGGFGTQFWHSCGPIEVLGRPN